MDSTDTARIARELQESKAASFAAMTEDGEKKLTAPKTKGRWDKLARLAVGLGAARVECRDAAGDTVAVVIVEEAEPVASAPAAVPMSAQTTELAALLRMVTESADKQVQRFQDATMATLGSSIRMLEVVTRRVDALEARQEVSIRGRERDLEANTLALVAMGQEIATERAEVERVIADAQGEKEPDQNEALVARLLEPLGLAIAAKVSGV